ncbi:MAG: SRPBCC family protein [Dehalococcoidia bacterium]
MSNDRRLTVSRTLAAPPERVFGVLADPGRHTELDGAGMLRGLEDGPRPVTAAGQAFVMNMNQGRLGDYRMRNMVVEFEANRRIVWAPSIYPPGSLARFIGDADPSGHIYRWELVPTSDGGTEVTHVYDWNGVKDPNALKFYPRVSVEQLEGTLDRLDAATR